MFEKGQSKRIWGELYKVVDSSDVVVQVVRLSCSSPWPICFPESFFCSYVYCYTNREVPNQCFWGREHWRQARFWSFRSCICGGCIFCIDLGHGYGEVLSGTLGWVQFGRVFLFCFVWHVYPHCATSKFKKPLVQLNSSSFVVSLEWVTVILCWSRTSFCYGQLCGEEIALSLMYGFFLFRYLMRGTHRERDATIWKST